MSHYLKIVMDAVFGRKNFQNEFVWYYSGGGASKKRWARKHDILLFYSSGSTFVFNADDVRVPYKWTKGQKRADGSGRDLSKGKLPDDVWQHNSVMPWSKERTGYPTQKPITLLQRIIKASSNVDDVVFDPFCGCATTCVAADGLDRQWIGIDISEKAAQLVVQRIDQAKGMFSDVIHRQDIPSRTDLGPLPRYNCIQNKQQLYGQQGGHCNGCRDHFQMRHLEVDHIIAQSKGGTDHLSNLELLCGHCNRVKGNRGLAYLRRRLCLAA